MPRDDFSSRTRRILGERAAYICSNPDCRDNTIGPHSDPGRSLDTGVAAHICAAAPGGPRYDANQTAEDRESITNGIWLCARCSRKVDTDEQNHSAELLKRWRSEHEQWIAGGGTIPKLPELGMEDQQGLSLPIGPGSITAEDCERLRERRLFIKNPNRVPLFQFYLRIQLPEPILSIPQHNVPPGVAVQFKPEHPQMFGYGSGGGSVTVNRPPRPTPNAILKLDELPPQSGISISMHTILDYMEDSPLPLSEPQPDGMIPLCYYVIGDYFFDYRNERVRRLILVPLRYEKNSRRIESLSPQSDDAPYSPVMIQRFA